MRLRDIHQHLYALMSTPLDGDLSVLVAVCNHFDLATFELNALIASRLCIGQHERHRNIQHWVSWTKVEMGIFLKNSTCLTWLCFSLPDSLSSRVDLAAKVCVNISKRKFQNNILAALACRFYCTSYYKARTSLFCCPE